jgi:hypothetical protein
VAPAACREQEREREREREKERERGSCRILIDKRNDKGAASAQTGSRVRPPVSRSVCVHSSISESCGFIPIIKKERILVFIRISWQSINAR